jgi:UDP-N-acetyl-2-amino-2-deoxyglucuronate dehydrogenase
MSEKIGVGIIGCGGVASVHARAWQTLSADSDIDDIDCEIVAVCDPIEGLAYQRMQDFDARKMYLDYHELLADERVDVVSICTPNDLHAPVAMAAATAGKHLIVEKPMAMNIDHADEMIKAAETCNTKLAVVFQRRVDPKLRFIKERVIPEIGEIKYSYLIDSHFRNEKYYQDSKWRGKSEGVGGVFANQAIHTWDILQWYQGGVDRAEGYWTNLLHPSISEVEDIGYGLVKFTRGSYGKLFTTSCCHIPSGIGGLRIFGTKGEVIGSDFSLQNKLLEKRLKNEMQFVMDNTKYTGQTAQILDLVHAIREDRPPEVSGDTAKESLKIIEGIRQHGQNHTQSFRKWAFDNFEMPEPRHGDAPIAEDAEEQDWRGDGLIEQLSAIVKSRTHELDVPFLTEEKTSPSS